MESLEKRMQVIDQVAREFSLLKFILLKDGPETLERFSPLLDKVVETLRDFVRRTQK